MSDLLQDAMRDRATTLLLPLDRKQGLVLIAAPTWSAPPPRPLCRGNWGMNGHNADIAKRRE
jgi:hypothetical protein